MSELKILLVPGLIGDSYVHRSVSTFHFCSLFWLKDEDKPTFPLPFPAIDLCILISCSVNCSCSLLLQLILEQCEV